MRNPRRNDGMYIYGEPRPGESLFNAFGVYSQRIAKAIFAASDPDSAMRLVERSKRRDAPRLPLMVRR